MRVTPPIPDNDPLMPAPPQPTTFTLCRTLLAA